MLSPGLEGSGMNEAIQFVRTGTHADLFNE